MKISNPILVALAAAALSAPAHAQIRTNPGFRAESLEANDDGSTPLIPIGWNLNFFGRIRSAAFVNNNGNITFDAAMPDFTPFGLHGVSREIIAPFFADVDTRGRGSALVTYGRDTVNGRRAFGVNYVDVGYFNIHTDKLNRFQLVLIEREDTGRGNFDIEFNYERISWETGDASGGRAGLGGVSASVGWSNGSGLPGTSFELPGSLVPGSFLDNGPYSLSAGRTPGASGNAPTGRWLFRAREGTIIPALTILTECPLPNATASRLYGFKFEAFGSKPPYRWTLIPDPDSPLPNLQLNTAGVLSGTPPAPGQYAFTVRATATDEDGDVSVVRRCRVSVDPPGIFITNNSSLPGGSIGVPYQARLRAEGGGGPFRFSLFNSSGIPGLRLNSDGSFSGAPQAAGTYQFQVQASSEGRDQAAPSIKRFTVNVLPDELSISGACPLPNGTGGVSYLHQFKAQGGAPPYRWSLVGALPMGLSLNSEGRLAGIPTVPHWWPFTVRVEDSRLQSRQLDCGLLVRFPEVGITSSCPLPEGSAGVSYNQKLEAAGGSGPYVWSSEGTLPNGLRLNSEGVLSGTPLSTGVAQFRLTVTDSQGQTAATACSLIVNRGTFGAATCPLPDAFAGEPYAVTLAAAGGEEPYSWSATTLPAGFRLSPDGYLSATPNQAGTYPISMRVTDRNGLVNTSTCNVRVQPQALRLVNVCEMPEVTMGQAFAHRLVAAGGVEPLRFAARGPLPEGLSLAANGSVTGTPSQAGLFPIEFQVTDALGRTAASACRISVKVPQPPEVRILGLPSTLVPASAGPSLTVELASAYPFALEGDAIVDVAPDTRNPSAAANQADPAVHFADGQLSTTVRFPVGARQATLRIPSTGTVASTITVKISRLRIPGTTFEFNRQPTPAVTRVNRSAPVVTNVCYRLNPDGFDVEVAGYSTTRDLVQADLTFGSNNFTVDLNRAAQEFFSSEDSVRTGGTFQIRAPYKWRFGRELAVGQGNAVIRNSAGASESRPIGRCQ